ncbi:voltage-dependent T-type calcium channel subunit alpha-1I isoform X3 [Eupeodes corollae]|uniref:voltage-dependent T-type calcium channel subunit alpha-1I isoform X3 n=1 Tax=Eupeodes corollae TaxID=290404 RepID=UPI0024931033|nr:voltage-dependent T-type calcium channel subunit alpha-1I isoform X3 [Eupeodes corollae]
MYQPCVDDACVTNRCKILQMFDDIIFAFFALEMSIKMVAMGMYGKNTYLADSWNRLDFFIVLAGLLEYVMHVENLNLTAIRTIRVLRPLRAINRIPSMRILVMLLLDTLPMLGNVLLLCFFVFFIFGIIGVQMWEGILRQRCVKLIPDNVIWPNISFYYEFSKEQDYICSIPEDSGMHLCADFPAYRIGALLCNATALPYSYNHPTNVSCVNWNQYYTNCSAVGPNPFQGTISFDNIGMAWVAIFLVISLEGWTDIMYYVQDAHSFWDWIYFVLLIVIGSFFMINLCLVVIATQFAETKKREMERMRQERARYTSTSTLASSTNNSEPATCYAEIVKYIAHLWRRSKRRLLKKYRLYKHQRQQKKEGLLPNADNLTFSPSRIKCHHPKCPKYINRKPSNIQDQMITVMVPLNSNNNVNTTIVAAATAAATSTAATTNSGNGGNTMSTAPQTHTNILPMHSTTANVSSSGGGGGGVIASSGSGIITTGMGPITLNQNLSYSSINSILHHHHAISIGNVANNNSAAGTAINNSLMQNALNHNHHQQNNPVMLAHNGTHNSSSENSELSAEVSTYGQRASNLKKTKPNHLKDDNTSCSSGQKTILLKIPTGLDSEQLINHPCTSGFLSPPSSARRRSSVMFNEFVILHTPPSIPEPTQDKNVCSSEKMTQTGDGTIWQVNLPQTIASHALANPYSDCSELGLHDAMTCQELLAFSVAFSAALPTGHSTLESFYTSLARFDPQTAEALKNHQNLENSNTNNILRGTNANAGNASGGSGGNGNGGGGNYIEDYSCCYDLYQNALSPLEEKNQHRSKLISGIITVYHFITRILHFARRHIKRLVEHKYFQQSILLAILINTLSMGIEYHKQPEELTAIVETSNVVFSAIFAVEMLLKVVAEGPFRYIANGFNVFDGIIVILSAIEICQTFSGNGGGGGSGLSVLRTFRLLRILKLVRFMPNLRRQLFVMLRTMDNVAVFFSLLVLFIFIFSILGMYLFGGKFCKFMDESGQERECTCPEIINKHPLCECDRKHFNNILWATVTVFQILTQEDWNVVLFNGMEKTSHWAALYFVALMTFGNYVLFNLLVAILVEGFSSERNERREREQRELVKKLREETLAENYSDIMYDESRSTSDSSSTNESYYEIRNKWHSAEDVRKLNDATEITIDPKCNIQKQRLLQPCLDYQVNESNSAVKKSSEKDISRLMEDDRKILKKTYSIKERRSESAKLTKLRPVRDPPIIMTTAATPQDSPNTTLESGSTFKNWNQQEFEAATARLESVLKQSHSSPSLLKPPTLLNAQCSLDEGIPSIEFIPPSPVKPHKTPINILSVSNLGSNTSINQFGSNRNLTDDITKNSTTPSTIGDDGQLQIKSTQNSTSSGNTFNTQNQKTPGLNRFRRSSSKKKKNPTDGSPEIDEENIILNNGRDSSQLLSKSNQRIDPFLRSANRIQNNTKDTNNKNSPQNSMRRLSVASSTGGIESGSGGGRRASCVYNNSQFYQNINRHNSMKNYSGRRMSSIEIAFGKASNLNLYNLEANRKSMSYTNSKIDLDKWQKSLSNLNEPEMLQQAKDEKAAKKKEAYLQNQQQSHSILTNSERVSKIKILIERLKPTNFTEERDSYSMYIFPEDNRFRQICSWFVNQKWFDNVVLLFIALNCITLAMERPNIPPNSPERLFLGTANYVFTVVFTVEMFVKVVATGMFYGPDAYFTSGWNIMDGSLVTISIIDLLMSLISESSPRIFGILRVFRLLRSLRPLRVINRAPGLKLVVQTLLSSLRPIGNIVLICCTFFIIFGILGVQLFKGTFYYCEGENIKNVRNMTDCLKIEGNAWINRKYNFDDLGKALMSLFVLSSRDGWVNIMYTGLDAVGVDQQPIVNYNEWRLLYFIAFILLVGFFVLNMFVGVVVENFHRCREEQEKEEKIRRAAKRALQMEKKRRRMHEPPYYSKYSPTRLFVHNVVTSKYFDLAIAAVIGLNVVTMAMEYYKMPEFLGYVLKIFNYFFTAVFILEAVMKVVALGVRLYMKDKWNQLDVGIVILSIVGIVLEELETKIIPINPTIIRVMRVLRIARVLKLLKMAKGIRALLDTVMQALPQVGNLGLLFFLLFFIFAALGVELFGRLECSDEIPCQGLGEHAHFANFGMAFLTLFRVATGDNWNGIMKDTLRDNCDDAADCVRNCCVSSVIAPIFFVIFVLMAQFVLVNVVVAVLMKHLEESHKQMEDEMDMDVELERELVREQEFEEEQALCLQLQSQKEAAAAKKPLEKVSSLPSNFTYSTPSLEKKYTNTGRRQTVQYFNQSDMGLLDLGNSTVQSLAMLGEKNSISEEVADGNDFNESEEARKAVAVSLQVPLGRRAGRRSSIAFQRKRGVLTKERSLDEQHRTMRF